MNERTVPAPKWLWLAVGEALLTGWVERTASKSRGFDRDKRVCRKSGIPSLALVPITSRNTPGRSGSDEVRRCFVPCCCLLLRHLSGSRAVMVGETIRPQGKRREARCPKTKARSNTSRRHGWRCHMVSILPYMMVRSILCISVALGVLWMPSDPLRGLTCAESTTRNDVGVLSPSNARDSRSVREAPLCTLITVPLRSCVSSPGGTMEWHVCECSQRATLSFDNWLAARRGG